MNLSIRTFRYVFRDLVPVFLLGILVFIFILLMFQALRLTEFVLIHGVPLKKVVELMGYLAISFLPAIFPMSLLFAVLTTYGRLSNDSEIIALKSIGVGMFQIILPALTFGVIVSIIAAKTIFELAPWGNRQFELMINDIGSHKAAITIREGTFSEGFFDLVIYANKVNSRTGSLSQVFIFDERRPQTPVTIVSKRGQIFTDPAAPGHFALLRLKDGSIHRKGESHTKIKFDSYDFKLSKPLHVGKKEKSLQSLTIGEVEQRLSQTPKGEGQWKLKAEYHKRWAISIACFIFALIGVGFGAVTNKRNAKSGGFVLSVVLIIAYWILYVSLENSARQGHIDAATALWIPNALFTLAGLHSLKKNWH